MRSGTKAAPGQCRGRRSNTTRLQFQSEWLKVAGGVGLLQARHSETYAAVRRRSELHRICLAAFNAAPSSSSPTYPIRIDRLYSVLSHSTIFLPVVLNPATSDSDSLRLWEGQPHAPQPASNASRAPPCPHSAGKPRPHWRGRGQGIASAVFMPLSSVHRYRAIVDPSFAPQLPSSASLPPHRMYGCSAVAEPSTLYCRLSLYTTSSIHSETSVFAVPPGLNHRLWNPYLVRVPSVPLKVWSTYSSVCSGGNFDSDGEGFASVRLARSYFSGCLFGWYCGCAVPAGPSKFSWIDFRGSLPPIRYLRFCLGFFTPQSTNDGKRGYEEPIQNWSNNTRRQRSSVLS
ncbi:hypothetical protein FB451DRAFT_1173173 [Mycena latifolia]|nr:hypothetical protein FB451DRAFT_1173173 [Mycena latifolia]